MTNCKRVSAMALVGATLMCACGVSRALGFGSPLSRATLGDTLWITVPLRLEVGEEIHDDCVAADVYFGDDKVSASAVSAALLSGPGDERSLRVSTTALVNEPIVTVYLAAGCHARITRKFVAFADPPKVNQPTLPAGQAIEMAEVVSAPSELSAAIQAAPRAQQGSSLPHRMNRMSRREKALAGAPVMTVAALSEHAFNADKPSKHSRSSSHKHKGHDRDRAYPSMQLAKAVRPVKSVIKVSPPADSGRLELDPVEAEAMVTPNLRMSGTLGSPVQADDQSANVQARREAAAAIWLALNATPEQMAHDRQRLMELEQRLAQLKQEGEQAKVAVNALTARAQHAESQTVSSTLSTLLGVLALAGVGATVYLWRQLRDEKKRTDVWWQSQGDEPQPTALDVEDDAVDDYAYDTSPDLASVMAPSMAEAGAAFVRPDAAMATDQATGTKPVTSRQVSVEELIDLEQQAEFFMVLGQEDAAIGLLEGHVQHTTGGSPLPFLQLLEAYHRADKKADYERICVEFGKRFESDAPSWSDHLQHTHNLADYPDVVERLQNIWSTPTQAMGLLDKSLTRPEPGAHIYDLPAYRELLFLYAVARDLSERDVHDRASVDLLLPVIDTSGKEQAGMSKARARADSLMSTRPIKAQPEVLADLGLHVDLPLEDIQIPEDIHKP